MRPTASGRARQARQGGVVGREREGGSEPRHDHLYEQRSRRRGRSAARRSGRPEGRRVRDRPPARGRSAEGDGHRRRRQSDVVDRRRTGQPLEDDRDGDRAAAGKKAADRARSAKPHTPARGGAVPGDRPLESFAQRRPRLEAEAARAPGSRRGSRRGWPFGIDVSQAISPVKPTTSATSLGELADRGLHAGAEVDRLGAVVALGGEREPLRRSRRRRGTRASASRRPRARSRPGASSILRISAGITCDVSRSKLSRGPVEVRRQQEDRVRAVLLAVGLRADEHRLLRDPVRAFVSSG